MFVKKENEHKKSRKKNRRRNTDDDWCGSRNACSLCQVGKMKKLASKRMDELENDFYDELYEEDNYY